MATCQNRAGGQGVLTPLRNPEELAIVASLLLEGCTSNPLWDDEYFFVGLTSLGHPSALTFLDRPYPGSSTDFLRSAAVLGGDRAQDQGGQDGFWPDGRTDSDDSSTTSAWARSLCAAVRILVNAQTAASSPPAAPAAGVTAAPAAAAAPPTPAPAAAVDGAPERMAACSRLFQRQRMAANSGRNSSSSSDSGGSSNGTAAFIVELSFVGCDGQQASLPAGEPSARHAFVCRVPADPPPPPAPSPSPSPPLQPPEPSNPGLDPPLPPQPLAAPQPSPPKPLDSATSAPPPARSSSGPAMRRRLSAAVDAGSGSTQEQQEDPQDSAKPSPPAVTEPDPDLGGHLVVSPPSPDLPNSSISSVSDSLVPSAVPADGQRTAIQSNLVLRSGPEADTTGPTQPPSSPTSPPPVVPSPSPLPISLTTIRSRCDEMVLGSDSSSTRYLACHVAASWAEAVQLCAGLMPGGTLAVLEGQTQLDLMAAFLEANSFAGSHSFWFGAASGAITLPSDTSPPLEYVLSDPRVAPSFISSLWNAGVLTVHSSCANPQGSSSTTPSAPSPPTDSGFPSGSTPSPSQRPTPPSPGSQPEPPAAVGQASTGSGSQGRRLRSDVTSSEAAAAAPATTSAATPTAAATRPSFVIVAGAGAGTALPAGSSLRRLAQAPAPAPPPSSLASPSPSPPPLPPLLPQAAGCCASFNATPDARRAATGAVQRPLLQLRQCHERLNFICQARVSADGQGASPGGPGAPTLVSSLFLDALNPSYNGAVRVFRAHVEVELQGALPQNLATESRLLGRLTNDTISELIRVTPLPAWCFTPTGGATHGSALAVLPLDVTVHGLPRATLANFEEFINGALASRQLAEMFDGAYLEIWGVQSVSVRVVAVEDLSAPEPAPPPASESSGGPSRSLLIIGSVVAGCVLLVGALAAFLWHRRWMRRSRALSLYAVGGDSSNHGDTTGVAAAAAAAKAAPGGGSSAGAGEAAVGGLSSSPSAKLQRHLSAQLPSSPGGLPRPPSAKLTTAWSLPPPGASPAGVSAADVGAVRSSSHVGSSGRFSGAVTAAAAAGGGVASPDLGGLGASGRVTDAAVSETGLRRGTSSGLVAGSSAAAGGLAALSPGSLAARRSQGRGALQVTPLDLSVLGRGGGGGGSGSAGGSGGGGGGGLPPTPGSAGAGPSSPFSLRSTSYLRAAAPTYAPRANS